MSSINERRENFNSFRTESNLDKFYKALYFNIVSSTLSHKQTDFNQIRYQITFQTFISYLNEILTELEIDNTSYNDCEIHNPILLNIENIFNISFSQDYNYQEIEKIILDILNYVVSNDYKYKYTLLNICNQFDYLNILNKDKIDKIYDKIYDKINKNN
jgi:hypothetical protein